jgi:hypothetical protein
MPDSTGNELQLRWISPRIPDDRIGVEEKIHKELAELDCDPLDIFFHTVFIDSLDGPCISVTPSDDKTCMECYYDESPDWQEVDIGAGPLEGNTVQIFDPKGKQRDESDS